MSTQVLGVGDFAATTTPGDALRTFALGSCVGVVILDPETRCVGMVHVALPDSKTSAERAKAKPGYFADTGIRALLDAMSALGCDRANKQLIVKLAGGAKILELSEGFDIGKKNQLAVKKHLWTLGLVPRAEDVGGAISRTMEVAVDTGRVQLTSASRETWEI